MGKFISAVLGTITGANPLHLAIAAGAVALVASAVGFTSGWTINGWRLGVQVAQGETRAAKLDGDKRELTVTANACGRTLETQNDAIDGWKAAALERQAKGKSAALAAAALAKGLEPELERLVKKAGEKAAAGAVRRCEDGLSEVRKGLQQ